MGRHPARSTCPFCGWWYSDREPYRGRGGNTVWRVHCCSCEALGPEGTTKEQADELWNKRARPFDRHGSPVMMEDLPVRTDEIVDETRGYGRSTVTARKIKTGA